MTSCATFVVRRLGLGEQFVELGVLGRLDVVEPVAVALHLAVGVGLLLEFAALGACLFEQVAKSLDAFTVGRGVALAQQAVHRLFEVAVLHEVVGEHPQHLFDVEVVEVIVIAEAAIAVANGH